MPKSRLPALSSPRRWTAAHAQTVLAALDASALSVAAFAAREGLDVQRLHFWRRRLENAAPDAPSRPMFVEVPLRAISSASERGRVEIVLRSGRVVRVDESIDAATLRRLIDVLDQESAC